MKNDRRLFLLLREAFGSARAVAHFTGKLSARGVDVVATCFAHRRYVARFIEAVAEGEHLLTRRLFEVGLRAGIEGDEIEYGLKLVGEICNEIEKDKRK